MPSPRLDLLLLVAHGVFWTWHVEALPFKRAKDWDVAYDPTKDPTTINGESQSAQRVARQVLCVIRGGDTPGQEDQVQYGRISDDFYRLTPEQIETFHRDGCVTLPNVIKEDEVVYLQDVFDRFVAGEIAVPGKDFCDMSKPFGIPYEQWSLVNCMLPTKYYPSLQGNVYERLTASIAQQLFPHRTMVKDYDQLLNKRPGKDDAVFAWHQDMAYWPGPAALVSSDTSGDPNELLPTDTCTFSLALDDSDPENGCLKYVAGSGVTKTLRKHRPLIGNNRDEGHALTTHVDENNEPVKLAPAKRGSITIHDEYVVHGSGGNTCEDRQRRTYVVAYRTKETVDAERRIGFTHSHNDDVNWDNFADSEEHRVSADASPKPETKVD